MSRPHPRPSRAGARHLGSCDTTVSHKLPETPAAQAPQGVPGPWGARGSTAGPPATPTSGHRSAVCRGPGVGLTRLEYQPSSWPSAERTGPSRAPGDSSSSGSGPMPGWPLGLPRGTGWHPEGKAWSGPALASLLPGLQAPDGCGHSPGGCCRIPGHAAARGNPCQVLTAEHFPRWGGLLGPSVFKRIFQFKRKYVF